MDHWIFQYTDLGEYTVPSTSTLEFEMDESILLPLATMPRHGRPCTRRHRGALESSTRVSRCGICGGRSHNRRTCPNSASAVVREQ